jgi:hypothetical protein
VKPASATTQEVTTVSQRTLQHPVPPELLVHIGDMTVSFALLETHLQMLMGSMLTDDQGVGQILSVTLPFRRLREVTASLYLHRHGDDEDFKRLTVLLQEAADIEEERNRITHSIWGAGGKKGTVARMKMTIRQKDGYKFKSEMYDEERLRAFAERIKGTACDISGFLMEMLKAHKAINSPGRKLWPR